MAEPGRSSMDMNDRPGVVCMSLCSARVLTGRRRRAAVMAIALTIGTIGLSACGPVDEPIDFQFTVEEVDRADLPAYPLTRMYRYHTNVADVDSLLRRVLNARIALDEVWEPIEDECEPDDTGPFITAVLAGPDASFEAFGFELGTGIRLCTARIRRWIVTRNVFGTRPSTPALPTEIMR
jgi:hypothetical protein